MNSEDWAYIAGFVDADGHIGGTRSGYRSNGAMRYAVRLTVTNANPEIANWLKKEFGGSVHLSNTSAPTHHRPVWRWSAMGRDAKPVLLNLLPYLRVKKKQAELVLQFIETLRQPSDSPRRLTNEQDAQRNYIVQQLRRLNYRGRLL